jgi:hypothetical protein
MRSTTSKSRKAVGIACIAMATLACTGNIVANSVGDQTPPYEPSPISDLAWTMFLICGALAAALGLLLIGWTIRDENRR